MRTRIGWSLAAVWVVAAAGSAALGEEIKGVQAAALDQPRIYMRLSRTPAGPAMAVKVGKEQASAVEAFLDTGASGIALAKGTYEGLGIKSTQGVKFEDVGVGGSEEFGVSEPVYTAFAPYSSNTDGDNPGAYVRGAGPVRVQLRPNGGILDALTGGTDVVGMPAMAGKVMVIDCRPVAKMDKLKTWLVAPGDRVIPRGITRTVPLTYVNFERFTRTTPKGAQGPAVAANPMIGPDPFNKEDGHKAVTAKYKGKGVGLTMLLDTGAATSMISSKKAEELGVTYATDGKTLNGVPANEQFSLSVGGIGGMKTSTGFYLDVLALPARSGEPITYVKAPVLVSDVTVVDASTGRPFTLDGVFGMNYLTASASISSDGGLPNLGEIVSGPFEWVVIDHAQKVMAVK